MKEIHTRFDLKDAKANIEFDGKDTITLSAVDEYKLKAVNDIFQQKLVKRGISLKGLTYQKVEAALGATSRQKITMQQGIPIEKAKEIVKLVKESKKKVQASIQSDLVRVTGQTETPFRNSCPPETERFRYPYQFTNYRFREARLGPFRPRFACEFLEHSSRHHRKSNLRDVDRDLAALERELKRELSDVEAITEVGEYPPGGGKRLRPALLLLSSKLLDYEGHRDVPRCGRRDYPHRDTRTRRHHRRGRNAPWAACGQHTAENSKCVLAGDRLCMETRSRWRCRSETSAFLTPLIELTQQMVEGELLQMEKLGQVDLAGRALQSHLWKTACLFHAVCTRWGQSSGAQSAEQEENLSQYGRNLGMAFQIVDDVLDLTTSENVLGKPVASDLREGKVTMAVIHALQRCTPAEHT